MPISKIVNTRDHIPEHKHGIKCAEATVSDFGNPYGAVALDLQTDLSLPATGATILAACATITAGTTANFQSAEYDTAAEVVNLFTAGGIAPGAVDASSVSVYVKVLYTE